MVSTLALAVADVLQDLLRRADLRRRGLQDRFLLGPPARPTLGAPYVGFFVGDLRALAPLQLGSEVRALLLRFRHPTRMTGPVLGGLGLGGLQGLDLELGVPPLNLSLGLYGDLPGPGAEPLPGLPRGLGLTQDLLVSPLEDLPSAGLMGQPPVPLRNSLLPGRLRLGFGPDALEPHGVACYPHLP